MDENQQEKPSKSQLKRDAEKLQDLGSILVKLPISVLKKFHLDADLFDAIKFAQSIKQNGALKRQLQFIGKVMRNVDTDEVQLAYDNYNLNLNQNTTKFHKYENWRDRFLNNEQSVFNDFINLYPNVDRQHLRQLQRNAVTEKKQEKAPKYARQLFKYLKEIIDQ